MIIVASVSCLYGIGSVETYSAMIFDLKKGESVDQREIIRKLVALQYKRNDQAFARGNFRVRGDNLEIFPSHYEDSAWRISFFGDDVEEITEFDPLTGKKTASLDHVRVFANSHYVTPGPTLKQAMEAIKHELAERLEGAGRRRSAARGAEARAAHQFRPGDDQPRPAAAPASRITRASSPADCRASRRRRCSNICPTMRLLFVDESHQTVPQIGAMARGDHRRKITLAEYGFRLPSCIDNRPLRFNEWDAMRPQIGVRLGDARARGR